MQTILFQIFKGYLPRILLVVFWNTLIQILLMLHELAYLLEQKVFKSTLLKMVRYES